MVAPKDLILAKPRDLDDHVTWLLEHEKFKEAFIATSEAAAKGYKSTKPEYQPQAIGQVLLGHMIERGRIYF